MSQERISPLTRSWWNPKQVIPPPPQSKLKETQRIQLRKETPLKDEKGRYFIPPPQFISK
jgi:hypothetical protein